MCVNACVKNALNLILVSNISRTDFPVFQPRVMLSLCLHFEEFQPIYAYKGYAY